MADGFQLPKKVAAELLREAMEGKKKFDSSTSGADELSYKQQSVQAMQEFSASITPALKNMKIAYFEAAQDCYEEKWLSESAPNVEQIKLCKEEKYDKIFGKFNQMVNNHRESDILRMTNCMQDASQDLEMAVNCFDKYISDIRVSNQ